MKEQANDLLNAPDPKTLTGLRDRAILALLLGCGLRRAELLRIIHRRSAAEGRPMGAARHGRQGQPGFEQSPCRPGSRHVSMPGLRLQG